MVHCRPSLSIAATSLAAKSLHEEEEEEGEGKTQIKLRSPTRPAGGRDARGR